MTVRKRAVDVVVSSLVLLLSLPLLVLIATAIRLLMGAPIFFRQTRAGYQGEPFLIFKFRTMIPAAAGAGDDQQRLTRLGNFLRRTSLDELPQLWNVLKGEMSLVGPRPLLMEYLDRYSETQMRRHDVQPGITGWAQINGRNAIDWETKFAYDLWYVQYHDFWLDALILLRTGLKMFAPAGITAAGHATMPLFQGGNDSQNVRTLSREGRAVYVIGGGGHAKSVIAALQDSSIVVKGVLDDRIDQHGKVILGVPIIGPISDLATFTLPAAVIAIGDNVVRARIAEEYEAVWLSVIHPHATVHESVTIGEGTVILAGAVIQPDVWIGKHAIVNTAASVDHDCRLGDFVHIGPGTHLAGSVIVEPHAFFGTGSAAIPQVCVGAATTVGAGACVVRSVPSQMTVVGVPARRQTKVRKQGQKVQPRAAAKILLSPPHLDGSEGEILRQAMESNWIAPAGPMVNSFESRLSTLVNTKGSLATSSCTAAIHLTLRHLGIGPGDEVLCSTLSFCASANPIAYLGAAPVFIDSESKTGNLDPNVVADELRRGAVRNKLPKAILAVDAFGQSVDMDALVEVGDKYGVPVIEDAAEALGSQYRGESVGRRAWASVFSFNGNKIITTSGGGAICSNDRELLGNCRYLASQARDEAEHYEHGTVGYNYQFSNLLAAVGISQLKVLRQRVLARRRNFSYYQNGLTGVAGIGFIPESPLGRSNRWLTVMMVDSKEFGLSARQLRQVLASEGIESRLVFKPLHLQPAFVGSRCCGGKNAEQFFANGLCLPSGSALTPAQLNHVIDAIRELGPESNSSSQPSCLLTA